MTQKRERWEEEQVKLVWQELRVVRSAVVVFFALLMRTIGDPVPDDRSLAWAQARDSLALFTVIPSPLCVVGGEVTSLYATRNLSTYVYCIR